MRDQVIAALREFPADRLPPNLGERLVEVRNKSALGTRIDGHHDSAIQHDRC